jgi:UDP-3-O-[3-hydroxymyristoyl] glucosamine N-acyltransferase
VKLEELAARLDCVLVGDGRLDVRRVAALEHAGPGDLSFVTGAKHAAKAAASRASALIVSPGFETAVARLETPNPYLAFARAVALLHASPRPVPGVQPGAHVHPSAELGEGVHVAPGAVVGARVKVGARSVLHAQVVLHDDVVVGEDCLLHSGAQVREGCVLGARVILQNGAVIGSDGFGFARDEQGRYHKIPQVGIVVLEDDVEIGALTAIDRAALHETRVGRGTKLDNLVQIGHSVTIGRDTVLAAQVGIAGSTQVGDRVTLGGQVGVNGHIRIGDGAIATAQSGLTNDVAPGAFVSGLPAIPNIEWRRAAVLVTKLPELQRRLRRLEAELAQLRAAREEG